MDTTATTTRASCASFRLLGTAVEIRATPRALLPYRQVFERFAAAPEKDFAGLRFRVSETPHGAGVVVEIDGRRESVCLDSPDAAFGFVYARILDEVTRRNAELICIHGAALARRGRGLAVVAPSRHGKSTLALALLSRGFSFLSDEVAAITRRSGRLLPFPMAIGCREGTARILDRAGFNPAALEERGRTPNEKMLFLPVARGIGPTSVPLHTVVFVEERCAVERRDRRYRLVLDRPVPDLPALLSKLDGVLVAAAEAGGRVLRLNLDAESWVAPEVEALLAAKGVLTLSVENLDRTPPDFSREPRIAPMHTQVGILALLHNLRGFGALEQLGGESNGGFGHLFMGLVRKMHGVRFFRLTPGKLAPMVDAIESVVDASPTG